MLSSLCVTLTHQFVCTAKTCCVGSLASPVVLGTLFLFQMETPDIQVYTYMHRLKLFLG